MKALKLLLAVLPLVLSPIAIAKGPGSAVFNYFSGYAWYQGTGSGLVHERWNYDFNRENCQGMWDWYPASKWENGPDECDEGGMGPFYWYYLGYVGDGSDILVPGEYWYCVKTGIFRNKYEP